MVVNSIFAAFRASGPDRCKSATTGGQLFPVCNAGRAAVGSRRRSPARRQRAATGCLQRAATGRRQQPARSGVQPRITPTRRMP